MYFSMLFDFFFVFDFLCFFFFFFFQAEDGIRDKLVTGVQTCALPILGDREEELVLEVLRSGRLSLGPKLEEFEHGFARWLGADGAVATSSGTAALHLEIGRATCRERV